MPKNNIDYGYLQHGDGLPNGPWRTERVGVKHWFADIYQAYFEGKWRKIFVTTKRTYIVYNGDKITIQVEGL